MRKIKVIDFDSDEDRSHYKYISDDSQSGGDSQSESNSELSLESSSADNLNGSQRLQQIVTKGKGSLLGDLEKSYHGAAYQCIVMTRLVQHAFLNKIEFSTAAENEFGYGKFDDVIFAIEGAIPRAYAFQLKHSLVTKELKEGDFLDTAGNDFSLIKYFRSYLEIKVRDTSASEIAGFFLYTNGSPSNKLLGNSFDEHDFSDDNLVSGILNSGKAYRLKKNGVIHDKFMRQLEELQGHFYSLDKLYDLINFLSKNKEITRRSKVGKRYEVFLSRYFENRKGTFLMKEFSPSDNDEFLNCLLEKEIKCVRCSGDYLKIAKKFSSISFSDDDINSFFDSLLFAFSQDGLSAQKKVIIRALEAHLNRTDHSQAEDICNSVLQKTSDLLSRQADLPALRSLDASLIFDGVKARYDLYLLRMNSLAIFDKINFLGIDFSRNNSVNDAVSLVGICTMVQVLFLCSNQDQWILVTEMSFDKYSDILPDGCKILLITDDHKSQALDSSNESILIAALKDLNELDDDFFQNILGQLSGKRFTVCMNAKEHEFKLDSLRSFLALEYVLRRGVIDYEIENFYGKRVAQNRNYIPRELLAEHRPDSDNQASGSEGSIRFNSLLGSIGSPVYILCGQAGMGKSTWLRNAFNKISDDRHYFPIFIDLNVLSRSNHEYLRWACSVSTMSDFISRVFRFNPLQSLFISNLIFSNRLVVFLDSYDEAVFALRQFISFILSGSDGLKLSQTFITTRKYMLGGFSDARKYNIYSLIEIRPPLIKEYLIEKWSADFSINNSYSKNFTDSNNANQSGLIRKKVIKFVEEVVNFYINDFDGFLGVPLQLSILSDALFNDLCYFVNSSDSFEQVTSDYIKNGVYELMEMAIDRKISIICEKAGVSGFYKESFSSMLRAYVYQVHVKLSLEYRYQDVKGAGSFLDELSVLSESDTIVSMARSIGILRFNDSLSATANSYVFSHDIYPEYFVLYHIKERFNRFSNHGVSLSFEFFEFVLRAIFSTEDSVFDFDCVTNILSGYACNVLLTRAFIPSHVSLSQEGSDDEGGNSGRVYPVIAEGYKKYLPSYNKSDYDGLNLVFLNNLRNDEYFKNSSISKELRDPDIFDHIIKAVKVEGVDKSIFNSVLSDRLKIYFRGWTKKSGWSFFGKETKRNHGPDRLDLLRLCLSIASLVKSFPSDLVDYIPYVFNRANVRAEFNKMILAYCEVDIFEYHDSVLKSFLELFFSYSVRLHSDASVSDKCLRVHDSLMFSPILFDRFVNIFVVSFIRGYIDLAEFSSFLKMFRLVMINPFSTSCLEIIEPISGHVVKLTHEHSSNLIQRSLFSGSQQSSSQEELPSSPTWSTESRLFVVPNIPTGQSSDLSSSNEPEVERAYPAPASSTS